MTSKQPGEHFGRTAPLGPVWLWTELCGTQSALNTMREQGRLPIWHRWYVSCGRRLELDTIQEPIDEVNLHIAGRQVLEDLLIEVKARRFFDWRTWSRKRNISPCTYHVRVVDNQGEPLYCTQLDGACKLEITLQ